MNYKKSLNHSILLNKHQLKLNDHKVLFNEE